MTKDNQGWPESRVHDLCQKKETVLAIVLKTGTNKKDFQEKIQLIRYYKKQNSKSCGNLENFMIQLETETFLKSLNGGKKEYKS